MTGTPPPGAAGPDGPVSGAPGAGAPVRVLVVDDEALVRSGLRLILQSDPGLLVVGEAGDGPAAVRAARELAPHVVLVDVRMPGGDGITATADLRALPDPPAVLVLTTFDLDDHVGAALAAGASGFLLKDTAPARLLEAIRVVASGQAVLAPTVTRRLIDRTRGGDAGEARRTAALARLAALTDRERDVVVLISAGLSNADVGARLFLGEATVKTHVSRALAKLGCENRVQLAVLAHDAGVVPRG